jgi:hypothetical protein
MMDGIKETVKNEIKKHIWEEVDGLIEGIAKDISQRIYLNFKENYNILNDARTIRMELLVGTPENQKHFESVHKIEMVEVKNDCGRK